MKMRGFIYFSLLLLFSSISLDVRSQDQKKIDSLKVLLKATNEDSGKAFYYDKLFNETIGKISDSAFSYAKKMAAYSEKTGNEKTKALANNHIAQVYFIKENRAEALNYLLISLTCYEKLHDSLSAARCLNNIGVLYIHLNQYANAKKYYEKALAIQIKKNDSLGRASSYGNLGLISLNEKKYDEALHLFTRSLLIKQSLRKAANATNEFVNIGNIYYYKEKFDSAFFYTMKAFEIRTRIKDTMGLATTCNNLGSIYRKLGKPEESIKLQQQAIFYCKRANNLEALKNAYLGLSEVYEDRKDFAKAFEYYKLQSGVKDSLLNESTNKSIVEMQTRFDSEKKEKENELLQKDNVLKDSQIEKDNTIKKYLYGFVGLVLAFAFVLYYAYNNKRKSNVLLTSQKEQIEMQKKEIIDSITYARRIQESLLPTEKYIERNLNRLNKKN